MGLAASTTAVLDYVWPRIRDRLDGLTDDEYLWEPVAGCWSVRANDGTWEIERVVPPPEVPPVTTIAWRTWHIGSECLDGYSQRGFQTKTLDLEANMADILLHVADELIHHGAEVALLRDLYLASGGGQLQ